MLPSVGADVSPVRRATRSLLHLRYAQPCLPREPRKDCPVLTATGACRQESNAQDERLQNVRRSAPIPELRLRERQLRVLRGNRAVWRAAPRLTERRPVVLKS